MSMLNRQIYKFWTKYLKVYKVDRIAHYSNSQVRVRFAPSPTGYLHLGGLRTALYNYLYAKSEGGKFILRIENTDTARTVPGSLQEIQNDLHWLSIPPDESPQHGGDFGPYIQSERIQIYKEHAEILLRNGSAYKCFCSGDRLKSQSKASSSYDNHCRTLTPTEVKKLTKDNVSYCIRFKLRTDEVGNLTDLIFGPRSLHLPQNEGDPVIMKTNGMPTYHLASVVDDHLMRITHVFRGESWLTSVTKHLQLYRSLNWTPPSFGHLPQILNLDGTKLSKRQDDLHIGVLRGQGFTPAAILNLVKLSGGGFEGVDHESLCSLGELVRKFRLDRINTHPAPLDFERLRSYNRMDFQSQISDLEKREVVLGALRKDLEEEYRDGFQTNIADDVYLEKVLFWAQKRIYTLNDFKTREYKFLWFHPNTICETDVKDLKLDSKTFLYDVIEALNAISDSEFTPSAILDAIQRVQKMHKSKTTATMKLMRLALTGAKVGPPVAETIELLGKDCALHRLNSSHTVL